MAKISIRIENLEALTKLASKFPAVAEKHVNRGILRALQFILRVEKGLVPVGVSASLRDRWDIIAGRFSGALVSGVNYGVGVEQGTPPHFVSPETLKAWCAKHGLNPYAVSKSILKKGTKANPFFRQTVDESQAGVDNELRIALENITKELANA